MESRSIAIVGAGISGLLACKYAISKGYRPVVLESQSEIGGVWAKTMEITKLQTPPMLYQFSDFPWPSTVTDNDESPTAEQVRGYVRAYAEHFGLLSHIRFNTKVLSVEFQGVDEREIEGWSRWSCTGEAFGSKGKWSLLLEDGVTQSQQVMQFDFVIMCIGQFSDLPNIPEFPTGKGPEVFRGKVMHSMDFSALANKDARSLIEGKRVVVVGLSKSALDVAAECVAANGKDQPCHLLYRTPRWILTDFEAWGLPYPFLYFNRFAELLLHKPGEGLCHSLLATALSPLRWLINKFAESDLRYKYSLNKLGLVPEHSLLQSMSSCLFAIVPEGGFFKQIEQGSLVLKKAHKFCFCKQGIVVHGQDEPLETDVVILATGFHGDRKLRNIFASKMFQDSIMGSPTSIVPLYRQCIHPRIPQLAVIGFSESIWNLYTSEMRSRWVMELLDGTFKLPEIKDMEKDISRWDKYMKTYAPTHYRKSCIAKLHIWYNDQLCKDMGWNPNRKKGLLSELFEPYGPLDYVGSS